MVFSLDNKLFVNALQFVINWETSHKKRYFDPAFL